MPFYEYYCDPCQHKYTSMRPMDERNDPAPCPKCSEPGKRQFSTFGYNMRAITLWYPNANSERVKTDPSE